MLQTVSPAAQSNANVVTISLIGDLDAELGEFLAQALDEFAAQADCDVVVDFDRVSVVHGAGLAAASKALSQHALAGRLIVAATRKRLVRAALAAARVPLAPRTADPPKPRRHVLIAHHAA